MSSELLCFRSLEDAVAKVYGLEGEDEGVLAIAFVTNHKLTNRHIEELATDRDSWKAKYEWVIDKLEDMVRDKIAEERTDEEQ